jgi:spore germination cell wall hydrolase CwlJ-like protein
MVRAMDVNAQKDLAVTGEDKDVLARTVFGEASGEPFNGKLAVAFVIINRAKLARAYVETHRHPHPLFGNGTIADACKIGRGGIHQFSCWNDGKDRDRMLRATNGVPGWNDCVKVAAIAIEQPDKNPIGQCTHYYNPRKVKKTPLWAVGLTPAFHIGNHVFHDHVN